MLIYRNCTQKDVDAGIVTPYDHPGSQDSGTPAGISSFWFTTPLKFVYGPGIYYADVPNSDINKSWMKIGFDVSDIDMSADGYLNVLLPEVFVEKPIKIKKYSGPIGIPEKWGYHRKLLIDSGLNFPLHDQKLGMDIIVHDVITCWSCFKTYISYNKKFDYSTAKKTICPLCSKSIRPEKLNPISNKLKKLAYSLYH